MLIGDELVRMLGVESFSERQAASGKPRGRATPAQDKIFTFLLQYDGELKAAEIAAATQTNIHVVNQSLNKLERRGLVTHRTVKERVMKHVKNGKTINVRLWRVK